MKKIICPVIAFLLTYSLFAQQYDVDTNFTLEELVYDVLLQNKEYLDVWNIQYTGPSYGIGYFYTNSELLPIKKGIVMSTGNVVNTKGPNLDAGESTSSNYPGDKDLDKIANGITYDAVVLEFDFITIADSINFAYFFGSEEYPEYVNDNVDDVFGFFVGYKSGKEKKNIAILPESEMIVSIENINSEKNNEYYTVNNILVPEDHPYYKMHQDALERSIMFELDGYSSLLYAGCKTIPGRTYHLKLALADVGDDMFDSGVFLGESSFRIAGAMKSNDNRIIKVLNKIPHEEIIDVNEDSTMTTISVKVQFAYNSYGIQTKYNDFLNQLIEVLKLNPTYTIELKGHTDDVGNENYNLELSEKRAESIANFMLAAGINKSRIKYAGYGNQYPIDTAKTDEARAKNRRVDFVIHKK
ncbi:MAG: OmpA family protein [Bacteroidales bacterium]|nr:OmpA family protein [Bacteroidales bacterium]